MANIYLDRAGVDACISKVNSAIQELYNTAQSIDATMNELPTYWQGASSDSAQSTYAEEYKTLLTKTVPEAVENFKEFINKCKESIVEVDTQLSGR